MPTDEELLALIDQALPSAAAQVAQIRHQNERDEATIALLEEQLRTGDYYLVTMASRTTRADVLQAIAGYRALIARRSGGGR